MKNFIISAVLIILILAALAPVSLDTFEPKPAPVPSAFIIFGGDMMFDRYIRSVSDTVGGDFILSCVTPLLLNIDLVMANLEGPITDQRPVGGLTFTFPPETAELLMRHNIGIVNLGNNHISNFGAEGVRATLSYLDAAGVRYFGDPLEHSVATTTVGGILLAFVNYNQFDHPSSSGVLQNIRTMRESDFLPVVYTHWGEEYQEATEGQKRLAHEFVDAGAEIVIGSHPHVVQEHEVYQGKHVYYSLGNFIFDQYFSPEVTHGLLLKVQFSASGVTGVEEIPIVLTSDGRTCPAYLQV